MKCNVCGRPLELFKLEPLQLTTRPESIPQCEIIAALTRGRSNGAQWPRVCKPCAASTFDNMHSARMRISAAAFDAFCYPNRPQQ